MQTENLPEIVCRVVLIANFLSRMESAENPFQANGELSQKADYIISHSTITRNEIHIEDPDTARRAAAAEQEVVQESRQTTESAAPVVDGATTPKGVETEVVVTPQAVEVEVKKASAAAAEPQHAEEVKLKKRRKCCSIQ